MSLCADQNVWLSRSFLDFVDGTFSDGGVNTCVAADGTIRLISLRDLNGDRHLDIVIACRVVEYHMTVDRFQKSYVYYGSADGFSVQRRLELPAINCSDVAIGDVDLDGHHDVVFANEGNTEAESGAVIHYGDGQGVSTEREAQHMPGVYSSAVELADLNREGHSARHRTELPTVGAHAAAVGDLDGRDTIRHVSDVPGPFRASRVELSSATWTGSSGRDSFFRVPDAFAGTKEHRWIQYRTSLISSNAANTSILSEVSLFSE